MKDNSLLKGNAIFEKYIRKNFLKYIVILAAYLIGFIIGIGVFNNQINFEENSEEISQYVSERIESIGTETSSAITSYIKEDFFEFFVISVLSFSIVGIPIMMILLFAKAVSLGVTTSALIYASGAGTGLSFSILIFMIPVILKIFAMLMILCSTIKFLENILKYRKEIKYEILRHAFVNFIAFLAVCLVTLYRAFSLNVVNQILF